MGPAALRADDMRLMPEHRSCLSGTWCSGITSASHAEGPGFNPQCVHLATAPRSLDLVLASGPTGQRRLETDANKGATK